MMTTSTFLLQKLNFALRKRNAIIHLTVLAVLLCTANFASAETADSSDGKKPQIINNLEQCGIPGSMIMRLRHLSPEEMKSLNEEYQYTDIAEGGQETVTVVKMRFIDDHITGYIKESPVSNSEKPKIISYIDIPIEWMCIPPKQDHPFHFATALSELDSIKAENGCLAWVQRDNEVIIKFAQQKEKKKNKSAKNK